MGLGQGCVDLGVEQMFAISFQLVQWRGRKPLKRDAECVYERQSTAQWGWPAKQGQS